MNNDPCKVMSHDILDFREYSSPLHSHKMIQQIFAEWQNLVVSLCAIKIDQTLSVTTLVCICGLNNLCS